MFISPRGVELLKTAANTTIPEIDPVWHFVVSRCSRYGLIFHLLLVVTFFKFDSVRINFIDKEIDSENSLLALVMVLNGCVSTAPEYSNTLEIIGSAAESAPDGVEGEYTFKIQAAGKPKRTVYLNTELDYRDQRNVTIALHPRLAK